MWSWVWDSLSEEGPADWYHDWQRTFEMRESDPEGAIALLDSLIVRATQAKDKWWVLFLEHWKLQALTFFARDFETALTVSVRATVEARKGEFSTFPQRVCLHEDLIHAYYGLDPVGYAPQIQQALDYMESEISPGMECESCLSGLRCDFYRSINHPEAVEAAWKSFQLSNSKWREHHGVSSYIDLCYTLAAIQGIAAREQLKELCAEALILMQETKRTSKLHELLMWDALAARWNNEARAPEAMERALNARRKYGAAVQPSYYFACVLFHEANEDMQSALQVIEEELQELDGKSEYGREAARRLKKCELLQAVGLSWEDEAAKVRQVARKLRNPMQVEEKLAVLAVCR